MEPNNLEVDFWEFVACSKCYLPFQSRGGPVTPFWLTECGHVVCNNHLSADRSCPQCRSKDIQLIPLQMDMEAPMSNWFNSIPNSLETIAYAAKFQHETMASQIRHLKSKVLQYRSMVEQLRREVSELTRTNMSLAEGSHQRSLSDYDPSELPNANGKRAMMHSAQQRKSASSPLVAPAGPDRLTLPLQQAPSFSPRTSRGPGGTSQARQGSSPYATDPRIDAKQYSYQAPATSQARLPRRSGTVQTFERAPGANFVEHQVPGTSYMPPQPRVDNQHSRFTPSTNGSVDLGPNARKLPPPAKIMGPPPTPQNVLRHVDTGQDRSMATNGRFAPPSTTPRRFAPRIEATRSLAPVAPVSRAPTNTQNAYGGQQRAPFMPGSFG